LAGLFFPQLTDFPVGGFDSPCGREWRSLLVADVFCAADPMRRFGGGTWRDTWKDV